MSRDLFRLLPKGGLQFFCEFDGGSERRLTWGGLRIGATTTLNAIASSDLVSKEYPALAEAASEIGDAQLRNRGTIGGNLSHADPASELPAIAVAMQARMRIKSAKGEREVAASEFFQGLLTTDIQSDEMLVEIAFPAPTARTGTCFMEVARRRGDFALAGVAAVVTTDAQGRCSQLRLALCGVGSAERAEGTAAA